MGLLFCKNCDVYYELLSNEHASDFECCSACGGKLEYVEDKIVNHSSDDNKDSVDLQKPRRNVKNDYTVHEKNSGNDMYVMVTISKGNTYIEEKVIQYQKDQKLKERRRKSNKSSSYKNKSSFNRNRKKKTHVYNNDSSILLGSLVILIGLIGIIIVNLFSEFIFSMIFVLLLPMGVIILFNTLSKTRKSKPAQKKKPKKISYKKYRAKSRKQEYPPSNVEQHDLQKSTKFNIDEKTNWVKGLEGENIVLNYLNTLPKDYYIFHDVNLPDKKGNIDHVVIGFNGIFVIETKNYSEDYDYGIDGDQWYLYDFLFNEYVEFNYNPVPQLFKNKNDLKRFLESRDVLTSKITINPIIAFVTDNFRIIKKSDEYEVLLPENIPNFILNQKTRKFETQEELDKVIIELKQYSTRFSFIREKIRLDN